MSAHPFPHWFSISRKVVDGLLQAHRVHGIDLDQDLGTINKQLAAHDQDMAATWKDAIQNHTFLTPMSWAIMKMDIGSVMALQEHGVSLLATKDRHPWVLAIQGGHALLIDRVINHGLVPKLPSMENVSCNEILSQNIVDITNMLKHLAGQGIVAPATINPLEWCMSDITLHLLTTQEPRTRDLIIWLIDHGADVRQWHQGLLERSASMDPALLKWSEQLVVEQEAKTLRAHVGNLRPSRRIPSKM